MKRRFTSTKAMEAGLMSTDESFSEMDTDREDCNLSEHEGTALVTADNAIALCIHPLCVMLVTAVIHSSMMLAWRVCQVMTTTANSNLMMADGVLLTAVTNQ